MHKEKLRDAIDKVQSGAHPGVLADAIEEYVAYRLVSYNPPKEIEIGVNLNAPVLSDMAAAEAEVEKLLAGPTRKPRAAK